MASKTVAEHRRHSPQEINCAVVTVSDTRTLADDKGGNLIVELLTGAGHRVADRTIVSDDPEPMRQLLTQYQTRDEIDAILMTGGTGISRRDHTYETVSALLTKTLPGYGERFRMLSFSDIGSAAMLSRTVGGLMEQKVVLTMPGSPAAVRLAMQDVILPELGHLVREARK